MTRGTPILVTGSHRSGTTWVGRMLSAEPTVAYIHEPFNVDWCRPGICGARLSRLYTYITDENGPEYYTGIRDTLAFRYNLSGELRALRSPRDAARLVRDHARFSLYRLRRLRPLIKDPFAVFSTEWLASRFGMEIVVLIRHPAAFVSSLKRLGWRFQFSHLLEQPLLMRDYLLPFESELREYAEREHDLVDQASLIWRVVYHAVARLREKHDDWHFIRHEDLSRAPMQGFESLFEGLGLGFSDRTRKAIEDSTDAGNPSDPEGGAPSSAIRGRTYGTGRTG